jgi:hypothetical protein
MVLQENLNSEIKVVAKRIAKEPEEIFEFYEILQEERNADKALTELAVLVINIQAETA